MSCSVTIIIPALNCRDALVRTLDSIRQHHAIDIQCLVVDGGSTDGTQALLQESGDVVSGWISRSDGGIYEAMNTGVSMSSGRWTAFIGAGDTYTSVGLPAVLKSAANSPDAIIYGDYSIVRKDGSAFKRHTNINAISRSMSAVGHATMFVPTQILRDRPFDQSLKIAADYEFALYCYKRGIKFVHCGQTIVSLVTGGVSSGSNTLREVREVHGRYFGRRFAYYRFLLARSKLAWFGIRGLVLRRVLPQTAYVRLRNWWNGA